MPPLDQPRSTVKLNDNKLKVIPLAAGARIFQGSLVMADAGFAAPATAKAGVVVQGKAREGADNTAGAPGAVSVEVERGVFCWDNDATNPVTQALLGKDVFAIDDHTVSSSAGTNRPVAGKLYQIDESGVWVETL